jgi:hypothetical protein
VHPALTLPPWLLFAVYALAVARLSVLVVEDRITEAPRAWALERLRNRDWRPFHKLATRYAASVAEQQATEWHDDEINDRVDVEAAELNVLGEKLEQTAGTGYLSYLLTCQWCISVWIALPAVIVWWNWPAEPWSLGPALLLAFSMITGKLSQIGG